MQKQKYVYLFPGQGTQSVGMGKDFAQQFAVVRHLFEEADDLLGRSLSKLIFEGPQAELTETKNSQVAIFVVGAALVKLVEELYGIRPQICTGLSLGEYTALYASGRLSFSDALRLVDFRGQFMNDACEKVKGTMAVIMGMDPHVVEQLVKEANLPNDLWIANYNCPGQIVISGTLFGVEKGSQMAKERGAKRIIPLQVHGAFHSGLMNEAGIRLSPYIDDTTIMQGFSQIVMNVPGDFVETEEKVRQSLVDQVTHSVRWEQGIRKIKEEDISCFIEFGPGTTLSGMNKKIGVQQPTISIQKVTDLQGLEIC